MFKLIQTLYCSYLFRKIYTCMSLCLVYEQYAYIQCVHTNLGVIHRQCVWCWYIPNQQNRTEQNLLQTYFVQFISFENNNKHIHILHYTWFKKERRQCFRKRRINTTQQHHIEKEEKRHSEVYKLVTYTPYRSCSL